MGAHVIAHRSYDRSTIMLVSFGQVPCDMVLRIAPSRRPPVPRMRLWAARAKARSRFRETQEAFTAGTLSGVPVSTWPGTVNLIRFRRDGACGAAWVHGRLCRGGHAGDHGPGLKGLSSGGSKLGSGEMIAAKVEQVVDLVVS